MTSIVVRARRSFAAATLTCVIVSATAISAAPPLQFEINEGRNLNIFLRDGKTAAHLLLRSGAEPRLLVAFPAGNSGVGLWFENTDKPVSWTLIKQPRAIAGTDSKGRALRGIEAEVSVNIAHLKIRQALLSSIRVLRDYQTSGAVPVEVLTLPTVIENHLAWSRDRLDGAAGYRLRIEALDGAKVSATEISSTDEKLHLKVSALSGETPLTPLGGASLLTAAAEPDARAREVLAFLSYREKFLAGSWRFDTYFGRDTLVSVTLLAAVLQPVAVESSIVSVLTRLAANGEVAHEEGIGEFAVLQNMKEGRARNAAPLYDYGMVDDDFMLAPLAAQWLLDTPRGHARAATFLSQRIAPGTRCGDALVRNLRWVVQRTAQFASEPQPQNLVGIKAGRMTGQWRDSDEGLGRGRYAYDVNAVLVPAALAAVSRLANSALLDAYLADGERSTLLHAREQHAIWAKRAPPFFTVTIPAEHARTAVSSYANAIGVSSTAALAALGESEVIFNALSLDATGQPIPVMHSDVGFALLYDRPTAAELKRTIDTVLRPFPAGLLTPIGMVVANPAFATSEIQNRFGNTAYHGTVVWSWQQAVLAAGLDHQLARTDLSAGLRTRLLTARAQLWAAIENAGELRNSELWSWSFINGQYRAEPFGQRDRDIDESNAAQLWSTVYLGLKSPAARTRKAIAAASD
jgi:hypothetical protein